MMVNGARFSWIRKAIERVVFTAEERRSFEAYEEKFDREGMVESPIWLEWLFKECMWRSWNEPFQQDIEERVWGFDA